MALTKKYRISINKGETSPFIFFFFGLILACTACSVDDNNSQGNGTDDPYQFWEDHEPFATSYGTFSLPFTEDYETMPEMKGIVGIDEASGLAYSVKNPGMVWSHNDSGNTNHLFLIDAETAQIKARYRINGTTNVDWEDMEIALDPQSGEPYIYVGDIGDNNEVRSKYSIYRFKEPEYQPSHNNEFWDPEDFSKIEFIYPDKKHDAETLFVDPETQDIYIVTKRDVPSMIFVAPYPQLEDGMTPIYKVGEFSFTQASAGAFSMDGKKLLIRTRQEIFYWQRGSGETTVEMLQRTPEKAPYIGEIQGEAICFDPDYNYYTLSEAPNNPEDAKLYKYFFNP